MKKFLVLLLTIIIFIVPTVFAEDFDTNIVSKGDSPSGGSSSLYKYWAYYKTTGTRYVIRVYDWNSGKYIAVPKEYYINHVYGYSSSGKVDTNKQVMYLGVDKTENGKYEVVKSGKTIFTDNTYSHIIKWYDNPSVKNFGLTKKDIDLLASIIKDKATRNGNTSLAKSMQDVIDGTVAYDVRAEILFLMKLPGTNGAKKTATVAGKGSMEKYNFTFYANKASSSTAHSKWRKDYLTYLEIKAICYAWGDDCGIVMKAYWLDKVACALFEQDNEYVFANGVYQCSCDLYKRKFGTGAIYTLVNNKINLNQRSADANDSSDRWYMYFTPGRCGIPINISGRTYYLTPGQTYNLSGNNITINRAIKYSNSSSGISAHEYDYLNVVTKDYSKGVLYEGWDYITSKLASILVIGVDKNTGNIITLNGKTYSKFEMVNQGSYTENAFDIPGYSYVGLTVKDNFNPPSAPVGVTNTARSTTVNITGSDIEKGTKKQVIFVYDKGNGSKPQDNYNDNNSNNSNNEEARLSVYKISEKGNSIMFTGKYIINNKILYINLYDSADNLKYSFQVNYDETKGYIVNTEEIEKELKISKTSFKYVGNLIKQNSNYFLSYLGETLNPQDGDLFNLKNINNNKVHIIIGYKQIEEKPPVVENPEIKVSYMDEKGNLLPGKTPVITKENVNQEIIKQAEDLRKDGYVYKGHIYVDTSDVFADIIPPLNVMGKEDNVKTEFSTGNQRRHIVFVYKKVELKFEIDIEMKVNDLENQYINQKDNEDYWVLDREGKVILKLYVSGSEGLNILGYTIKLRLPFDTYMNGNYIPAGTINNLNVRDLSEIVVADKLIVPIWVTEKEYICDATIEANVEDFGIFSATKTDNVEIIGRLYDFTVTNIDGSDATGDVKWKESLFENEDKEYKANSIPVGQSKNQPDKYSYGIKLGTTFYFSVNTKGIKNNAISIVPKFLYVSEDGKTIKEVTVYINNNGKMTDILSDELADKTMKLRDSNILKSEVIKELAKAKEMSATIDRYNFDTSNSRVIGKLSNTILSKYVSTPYLNYINEFKALYGNNAMTLAKKTENALLTYATHWYGKYAVPASSIVVEKDAPASSKEFKDGYLILLFKIISLDSDGNGYLSYELPKSKTQWQRENLNQIIDLPIIKESTSNQIVIDSLKDGYAPVIIYQIGVSTKDNNTSVGTH